MQKVFEKIKERLEKERKEITKWDSDKHYIYIEGADWMGAKSIEIVDQVAKEFADDTNVGHKNGWIPCSERLPKCEDYSETDALLFQLGSGTIEAGYFGKKNAWRDCYFRHYRGISGVDAKDVMAWQPLPEQYKEEK